MNQTNMHDKCPRIRSYEIDKILKQGSLQRKITKKIERTLLQATNGEKKEKNSATEVFYTLFIF